MGKNVTLADIGRQLGVSTVTVSKALSGQKGVSRELREKIEALADEMGYRKKEKNEENRRMGTLGVIVADRFLTKSQSFYWGIYQVLAQRAAVKNCFTILEVVDREAEQAKQMPGIIAEKRADGLIVLGGFDQQYGEFLVKNAEVPVVALDTTAVPGCDAVVADNIAGGYCMTDYLLRLGHRRIGYVGTVLATSSIEDRYLGYTKALLEHGIAPDPDLVIDDRGREEGIIDDERYFALPEDKMPTAFFCNCDVTAQHLIRKLNRRGIRVPEDISVVGFDNYTYDEITDYGITTYEINQKSMVNKAVHVLTHHMMNSGYSNGISYIPGRFIERGSAAKEGEPVPFV